MGEGMSRSFSSRGVETNTVSIINNYILDTYSSGFSILQELVQNANDAKASKIVFKILPNGIRNACHPLLRQSLLLVMNDGPFSDADDVAIGKLGEGSKSRNNYSIGKFGLGMKSLYHLCDMMFYCTTDRKFAGYLNPYAGNDGKDYSHPEWNYKDDPSSNSDVDLLMETANAINEPQKTSFCLFTPLRQNDGGSHIRQNFFPKIKVLSQLFADDPLKDSNPEEFIKQLQNMFATLSYTSKTKTLKSLRFLSEGEDISCNLTDTQVRTSLNGKLDFVTYYTYRKCLEGDYLGNQIIVGKYTEAIKSSDSWPKSRLIANGNETVEDKMQESDCSLIFLKRKDAGRKTFNISWASYLPLKQKSQMVEVFLPEECSFSYSLIFNGAFAIDSGRNGIVEYSNMLSNDLPLTLDEMVSMIKEIDSQEKIMGQWNALLFQKILSLEIPSFLLYVKDKLNISKEDFNSILSVFQNKKDLMVFRNRATVCESIIVEYEGDNIFWKLSKKKEYCQIPFPKPSLRKDTLFLNFLSSITGDSLVFYKDTDYAGLYNKASLHNVLDERIRSEAIILELQEAEYQSFFEDYYIVQYLTELFKEININKSEAIEYIALIKAILISKYEKNSDEFIIEKIFIDFICSILSKFDELSAEYYLLYVSMPLSDIAKSWRIDTPIVLLPYTAGGISKMARIDVTPNDFIYRILLPMVGISGKENAGPLFEASINGIFGKSKIKEFLDIIPDDLCIIPVKMRSFKTGVIGKKTYINRNQCNSNLFLSTPLDEVKGRQSFFEFAPEIECCYEITQDNAEMYGISGLEKISIISLVRKMLCSYVGYRDAAKAETLILEILKEADSPNILITNDINSCELFPTTVPGQFAGLFKDNSFLDLYNLLPDDFIPDSGSIFVIHIHNEELAKKFKDYSAYSPFILDEKNALEVYLKITSNPKMDIISSLLKKTDFLSASAEKALKSKRWYSVEGGKCYFGSELVLKNVFSPEVCSILESKCLLLDKSEIDEDIVLRKLFNNVISKKFSDIRNNLDFISGGFSLLGCSKNINNIQDRKSGLACDAVRELIKALKLMNGSEFRNLGWILDDSTKNLKNDSVVDEFDRICRLLVRKLEDTCFSKGDLKKLLSLLSQNKTEFTISIYEFLFKSVKSYGIKLDSSFFSEILFPSEGKEWRALSSLCNPRIYGSIQSEFLLSNKIDPSLFEFNSSDGESAAASITPDELDEEWPSVNIGLKAMLLYISMRPEYRPVAFQMMNQHMDSTFFNTYLKDYKPVHNIMPGEPKTLLNCDINDAFAIYDGENCTVKKSKLNIVISGSKEITAETITGNMLKVPLKLNLNNECAYSSIIGHGDRRATDPCDYTISILSLKDVEASTANKLVVKALSEILNLMFMRQSNNASKIDYSRNLNALINSDQAEMDVTREIITEHIDEILNVLKVTKDGEGLELSKMLEKLSNLEQDKFYQKTNNNDYAYYEKKIDDTKKQIVSTIENNISTSQYVLGRIKDHLVQVQYDYKNIPFEIFQNADDAIVQRYEYENDIQGKALFKISYSANEIVFEHNGRPINYCPGNLDHEEWRRDFSNMLSFKSSKNCNSDIKETGKFGFGFKSCYFISDEPRIHSGRTLAARIIGGIVPKYDKVNLKLGNMTRIVLPLNDCGKNNVNNMLEYFEKQIPGLLLFSLKVEVIEFRGIQYEKKLIEKGNTYSIYEISGIHYLQVHSEKGSIVFKIDRDGIKPINSDLVRYWSTTPLRKEEGARYMLNSPAFKVDTGRKQLAFEEDANTPVLIDIANPLGNLLCQIAENSTHISYCKCTSFEIVSSIMKILAESKDIANCIFSEIKVCLERHGFMFTGYEVMAIPRSCWTCMVIPNEFQSDLWVKKLNKFISDCHQEYPIVLMKSSKFIPEGFKPQMFRFLNDLVDITVGHKVSPNESKEIAALFEKSDIEDFFYKKHAYIAENGEYSEYENLIGYNTAWACIAPKRNIASYEYPDIIKFEEEVDKETSKKWIIDAETSEKRENALKLLARNLNLLCEIQNFNIASWVTKDYQGYMSKLTDYERINVIRNMGSTTKNEPIRLGEKFYNIVMDWWDSLSDDDRDRYVKLYRKYEFGVEYLDLSSSDNQDWYKLLYLTVLKGKGRTPQGANISFVNHFISTFDKYRENPFNAPDDWLKAIVYDDMMDGSSYEDWRKFMPAFAQVTMSAEFLYERFTNALILSKADSYEDILSFRDKSMSSGTDFEIPNLKACLGKSYSIILRELLMSENCELDSETRSNMMKECCWASGRIKKELCCDINSKQFYQECRNSIKDDDNFSKYCDYPFQLYFVKDILKSASEREVFEKLDKDSEQFSEFYSNGYSYFENTLT